MDSPQVAFNTSVEIPLIHHILSGSFRSLSLFLLAFSPIHKSLSLVQTIDAFGPHQYLATNPRKDRAYTTSWALPPALSSWSIEQSDSNPWILEHINTVPISLYILLLQELGFQLTIYGSGDFIVYHYPTSVYAYLLCWRTNWRGPSD